MHARLQINRREPRKLGCPAGESPSPASRNACPLEATSSTLMKRLVALLAYGLLPLSYAVGGSFDHSHRAWTELLRQHVVLILIDGGSGSQVRYAELNNKRTDLKAYLDTLSSVTLAEFEPWSKARQLAFLLNAYNAFTVELILTRYPDLASIRDFGRFIDNPWKKRFFKLLGQEQNLDGIEHGVIRAPGVYDEPRIHMAVNCASIGCPMLREEAYVADRLAVQLEEQVVRFLSDRSRNRYDGATRSLEVSEIFDWYREDFSSGFQGIRSREQFFAKYAELLTDDPGGQTLIRSHQAKIRFVDYDWALNDFMRQPGT